MSEINRVVSTQLREEKQCNTATLTVGSMVMAVIGKGMFANCFPAMPFTVAKINKKTFKTTCNKTIDLINIREIK